MYEVFLERRAERDLRQLSAKDFQRLISHIKTLAENPRPSGCRKITGSKSDWRIRVGDYRIIYEIELDQKIKQAVQTWRRRNCERARVW